MCIRLMALFLTLCAGVANADYVTINVGLDSLATGKYHLRGQSAFLQTRTSSGTSGGQLDGVESGGATIQFNEAFPPPTLSDYLGFAYFGILETLDDSDAVIDTSLIVAFDSGSGVGQAISDTFPYNEATLVNALTTSFDSAEFLDMLGLVPSNATTLGDIAVPPIGRPGTVLNLVAFTGGLNGDLGVTVGTLGMSVVPEPATCLLLILAVSGWCLRRGRAT